MAGIKRAVRRALEYQNYSISGHASHGRIAGGLASEGYDGGYAQALRDVLLALDGNIPSEWIRWEAFMHSVKEAHRVAEGKPQ